MNLIEELGLENCKAIVEGAPKHAEYYSPLSYSNKYKKSVRDNTHEPDVENGYTKSYDFWDGRKWNGCACMLEHLDDLILISSIRTAIAEHGKDFKVFDSVTHCKYEGIFEIKYKYENGTFRITDGTWGMTVDASEINHATPSKINITDDCSDIRNHVSPNTVVIER